MQKILCPDIVMIYYLMNNWFAQLLKMLHMLVCVTFLTIISNFPKYSCVLNCCSECSGFFVPDADINCKEYLNLSFICFHHYKNISSCSLQKHLFPEHEKAYNSYMNLEIFEKGNVTTHKILVLKSCRILDFHLEYYIPAIEKLAFHLPNIYILGGNYCTGKQHDMFVSQQNKFDWKFKRDYA